MGCDVYVYAKMRESDEAQKMRKIAEFCEENDVSYPSEVEAYFRTHGNSPDDTLTDGEGNVLVNIDEHVKGTIMEDEYVYIDLKSIPKEVETIVIVTSC